METESAQEALDSLVEKLRNFARTLSPDERDVLGSILELSAVAGSEAARTEQPAAYMINLKLGGMAAGSNEESILASLPRRVLSV